MRKNKDDFIGRKFLCWEVIKENNDKKYYYTCKCECGNKKQFYKYNLLKGSFSLCPTCGNANIKNISIIRKHWNIELNGCLFSNINHFDINKSYWFICNNNHNFKSSIKDFTLSRCLSCKNENNEHSSLTTCFEFSLQLFRKFFKDIVACDNNIAYISSKNLAICFHEENRFSNFRQYYKNELEYLTHMEHIKIVENNFLYDGKEFKYFSVSKNFLENVENLEKLVLKLSKDI